MACYYANNYDKYTFMEKNKTRTHVYLEKEHALL